MKRYENEGYPRHNGLAETCIIMRKHNEYDCMLLDNTWAGELVSHSHRDQLSFDYSRWKTNTKIGYFELDRLNKDNNFRWSRHNG